MVFALCSFDKLFGIIYGNCVDESIDCHPEIIYMVAFVTTFFVCKKIIKSKAKDLRNTEELFSEYGLDDIEDF